MMQLEDLLNDNSTSLWRVSKQSFEQLELEVQKKAKDLGYEAVIVDFANSMNIYTLAFLEGMKILNDYMKHKVIWLHKNVEQASGGALVVARAHAQSAGDGYRGMRNHIFFTAFDELPNELNPMVASPYSNIWGRCKKTQDEEYISKQLSKIRDMITTSSGANGDMVKIINIVGENGTGKTTIFRELIKSIPSLFCDVRYNSMQRYGTKIDISIIINDLQVNSGRRKELLLLDEADLVSLELHNRLVESYTVIVYASHLRLAFVDPQRVLYLQKAE